MATATQLCDIFDLSKDGKKVTPEGSLTPLKFIMQVQNNEASKTKIYLAQEDKAARLADFLEAPKDLGTKDLAAIVR